MRPVSKELGKSFTQTFVGVNVIVTTKPFKVAPFLTDWVNYKQIKQAMSLQPIENFIAPKKRIFNFLTEYRNILSYGDLECLHLTP